MGAYAVCSVSTLDSVLPIATALVQGSCNLTPFTALMATAAALIAGAIAAVITAAVLNNGFFTAPGSPAAMVTAGALTLGAIAALAAARGLVSDYYQCMGAPPACAGALANLLNALAAIMTVLSIQATACFVVAGIAWIPWAGAVPMYVILGALIIQAALIPTVIAFATAFVDCVNRATEVPPRGGFGVGLLATMGVVVLTLVTGVAHGFVKRGRRRVTG